MSIFEAGVRIAETVALVYQAWFGGGLFHARINQLAQQPDSLEATHALILENAPFDDDQLTMCPHIDQADFYIKTTFQPKQSTKPFFASKDPIPGVHYDQVFMLPVLNDNISIPENCFPIVATHSGDENGSFTVLTVLNLEQQYSTLGVDFDLSYLASHAPQLLTMPTMHDILIDDAQARELAGHNFVSLLHADSHQLIIPTIYIDGHEYVADLPPDQNLRITDLIGYIRQVIAADNPQAVSPVVHLHGIPDLPPEAVSLMETQLPPLTPIASPTVTITPTPNVIESAVTPAEVLALLRVDPQPIEPTAVFLSFNLHGNDKMPIWRTTPSIERDLLWQMLTTNPATPAEIKALAQQITNTGSWWIPIRNFFYPSEKDVPILVQRETLRDVTSHHQVLFTQKTPNGILVICFDINDPLLMAGKTPDLKITTLNDPILGPSEADFTSWAAGKGTQKEVPAVSAALAARSTRQIESNANKKTGVIVVPTELLASLMYAPKRDLATLLNITHERFPTIPGYIRSKDGDLVPINIPSTIRLIGGGITPLAVDGTVRLLTYGTFSPGLSDSNYPDYFSQAHTEAFKLQLQKIFPDGIPPELQLFISLSASFTEPLEPLLAPQLSPTTPTPTFSP